MGKEDQVNMFHCGQCGHKEPFRITMQVEHGARAYIRCPKCSYEESDRDYTRRKLLEES